MYYAHIREDGTEQSVEEHLTGTGRRSGSFAADFGEEARGRLIGDAHDIGKRSQAFQKRLNGGPKVDHATAGALECAKIGEEMIACCVMGHHGGLPDYGNPRMDYPGAPTFVGRLRKGMNGDIPPYCWEGKLQKPGDRPQISDYYTLSMWIRMLYSCLVDADFLDTEAFMSGSNAGRSGYDPLPVLLERLSEYISPWRTPTTELNRNRCAILEQCLEKASGPRGIYTLTVPTGGGKTVSSLAFGLKHAVKNGMKRVIYVVPYTSIIEQNAAVFREILGENNVVEHHSGVCLDEDDETNRLNRFQRLAAENWDAPVIVTTAVQFFESFYSNRPSQCRKLHNVANSVVIFDEAQMLPTCHLLPCVGVMANLAARFRSTIVLCTATQPVLADLFRKFYPNQQIREICPEIGDSFQKFRRVTYRDGGKLSNSALAEALSRENQVLCIVNTRKAAQEVFNLLPQEGRFHLSTLLYPQHRKEVLDTVRKRLKDDLPCRVVSTSLIEAGVDVDFPAVYRQIAGLDSIAQAAGRCNREGKRTAQESIVTFFRGESPTPILQKVNIQAAQEALQGDRDPGDPKTMERYFTALRSLIGDNIDKNNVIKIMNEGLSGCMLPFETLAKSFHLIDRTTCTVYIPMGDGADACQPLVEGRAGRADYRRAGQYGVSVYQQHYEALYRAGAISLLTEDSAVLTDMSRYDPEMGLSLTAEAGEAFFT